MSKPKFVTSPTGAVVAVEKQSRRGYEKRIERLGAENAILKGAVAALRSGGVPSASAAPAPAPVAPPAPPAPPPAKTHREVYREMRAQNPYSAAQYLLNHARGLDLPAPPEAR